MAETIIGKYIRLSQSDRDLLKKEGKKESESISHQRDLLQNFINTHKDLKHCKQLEFFDDGYSGTNFERPAFERMMEKVKRGEINCIIVKDFSRFGRNYIELGDYLERIFPYMGIRFISVNDGYDSINYKGTTGGLNIAMKNIVYDYYSKDLSVKVSTAKRHKATNGEFMGGHAPYGYKRHDTIKNKLAIDEEVANVVREIFDYALEGYAQTEIAIILNKKGYETPSAYFRRKYPNSRKFKNTSSLQTWTNLIVRGILQREVYYGAIVFHQREKVDVSSKSTRKVAKEEQIIVEGMHEGIVSKEEFLEVQKTFHPAYPKKKENTFNYPLQGKVRCGYCKRAMQYSLYHAYGKKYSYFVCHHAKYQDGSHCSMRYTKEETLNEIVYEAIMKIVSVSKDVSENLRQIAEDNKTNVAILAEELENLQKEIRKCDSEKFANIDAFMDGKLKKDEYQKKRMELEQLSESLKQTISAKEAELEKMKMNENSDMQFELEQMMKYMDTKELSKEMVRDFVKTIYVYDPERVEIEWAFSDEMKEILNRIVYNAIT